MKMTMKTFNRKLTAFICLIVLSVNSIILAVTPKSNFTLLVYMNGSNLESEYKLATHNIEDMVRKDVIGEDDNLTILLLMGGTKKWHLDEIYPGMSLASDSITYATITHNGFQKIRTFNNQSIGHPSTLTEFINYGMKVFPADKYGLILWNHGAGSVFGFGYDEQHPDDTSLSLAEIRQGLQAASITRKFTFIGFDACLMATLETALAISPYADYLVASQELEPGKGWDYKSIVRSLQENPLMEGEEIGKLIVDSFIGIYKESLYEQATLSVTNLGKVSLLAEIMGDFSAEIRNMLEHETNAEERSVYQKLSGLRADSKSFGIPTLTYNGPDMVDLLDLCRNMGKEADPALVNKIASKIQETVVYTGKSENLNNDSICGLSIYFPCYNIDATKELSEYQRCGINPEHLRLINTFAQRLQDGSRSERIKDIAGNAPMLLSTEMIMNLRKAYAIVLASDGDRWVTYGLDGDGVSLDYNGRIIRKDYDGDIMKEWNHQWISIGGKTVSAYMSQSDAHSLTYTIPVFLNNKLADLILIYDSNNPSGKIHGARRITDNNIPDKGITEIKANDTITLLHERFDENGFGNYIPGDTIIVKKKKDMKVGINTVPNGKYRYGYCLVDLYGRKYYTKFTDYEVK